MAYEASLQDEASHLPKCAKLSLWPANKTKAILSLLSLKHTQHQDPPFPTHKPMKVSGLSVLVFSHAE